jgi:hypothetical protein
MSKISKIIILISIISFTVIAGAGLGENVLKISLTKYDPYPINPGSDLSIWVEVENIGDNDVSGASIEFVETYPFSIKPGDSAIKNPGIIRKNDKLIYKFLVHVDKNAFVGTNSIEIGSRIDGSFTKRKFDIEVGSDIVNSKGTVKLDKFTIYPSTLMPGDTATVTLSLKNSATENTIKMDGTDYSMNAQVQSAELQGNGFIDVTSEPYVNTGIIGPGDSVELPFTIKVKNDAPDGTYFLDLNLQGNARLYTLNLKIPVTIDSNRIEAVLAEAPKLNPGQIILNVANNRPNTIYASTVIPGGNASFEPGEYFIGTMDPDELFTVKFDIKDVNDKNLSFRIKFKNGNNWHESDAFNVKLNSSKTFQTVENTSSAILPVIGILAGVLIIIAGFFIYMRRKRAKSAK